MIVGAPREIKQDEGRVSMVPSGVSAFIAHGHTVLVEQGAGLGSGIPDAAYRASGALPLSGSLSGSPVAGTPLPDVASVAHTGSSSGTLG